MRTPMRRLVRRPGEPTTSRRATSAFAARLAGSVVGVAGITLMGAGTFGSPGSVLAAGNGSSPVSDFTCSNDQVCIHTSQVPTTGDQAGCADIADLLGSSLDSTDSYWHFVIPDSQGFEFNGTSLTTNFTGGSFESVTFVQQRKDGGYKGAVVEADGGVTLNWASVPVSGIIVESAADSRDFNLSSSCAGDATSSSATSSTSQTTTAQSSSSSSSSSSTTSTTSTSSHHTTTVTDPCTISEDDEDACTTTTTTHTTTSTANPCSGSEEDDVTCTTTTTHSTTSTSSTTPVTTTTTSSTASTSQSTSSESSTSQSTSTESSTSNTSNASGATTSLTTVSSSSATQPPSTSVLGASTTTPSTGADVEFGFGIALLLGGAAVMIGATRMSRNKRQ